MGPATSLAASVQGLVHVLRGCTVRVGAIQGQPQGASTAQSSPKARVAAGVRGGTTYFSNKMKGEVSVNAKLVPVGLDGCVITAMSDRLARRCSGARDASMGSVGEGSRGCNRCSCRPGAAMGGRRARHLGGAGPLRRQYPAE